MEEALDHFIHGLPSVLIFVVIAVSLGVLGKAADWLVDEAVVLSKRSGIPTTIIGATIVSLGTTTPEAAVSVFAAIEGQPALALGNAVGSIICDTGLILGLACVIAPLRLDRRIVNRQGWIQLGAAVSLVLLSFPWSSPAQVFSEGGNLPRWAGFALLAALGVYIWQSIRWAGEGGGVAEEVEEHSSKEATGMIVLRLIGSIALVVVSARVLIPAVIEIAVRMQIPESIIAATLVAFGTSLPELVTAVTAARRGHGELAIGNIVGADILNVFFVAGAAAAVTPGGLLAGGHFFLVLFPIMVLILLIFRAGIIFSGDYLKRPFGYVLLIAYAISTIVSYLLPGPA
ncbi:MAG: sodium:calcium antiporter [Acidobacteria bacterium]|nr:sodium:calcium antiporter [Acidobacteriota bacterium]